MKKLFLVAIATVGFAFSGTAQDTKMKVGVDFGIPMGDIKDATSFNLGVNGAYMWTGVAEGFDAGIGVSYNMYFGKEMDGIDIDPTTGMPIVVKEKAVNSSFLPIYGTVNYSFTENIFAGADLGYALGLAPSGVDGGVYYQPKVGYQTDKYEFFLGYKAISSKQEVTVDTGFGTITSSATSVFASLNIGFNYKF